MGGADYITTAFRCDRFLRPIDYKNDIRSEDSDHPRPPLARPTSRADTPFSRPAEEDGAHTRPEMLSTGLSVDTCDFHRPGRLLVLLRLRGGAVHM